MGLILLNFIRKYLLLLVTLAVGVFLSTIVFNNNLKTGLHKRISHQFNSIGTAKMMKGQGHIKSSKDLYYRPLSLNTIIHSHDKLQVSNNGELNLVLFDESKFHLAAKTKLQCLKVGLYNHVHILKGNAFITLGKRTVILVANKKHRFIISGNFSDFNIQMKSPEEFTIASIMGEITIQQDDILFKMDEGKIFNYKFGKISHDKKTLTTMFPRNNQIHWVNQEKSGQFIWQYVPGADRYKLEISLNGDFKNILVGKNLQNTQYISDPLPFNSSIYWRVKAYSGKDILKQSLTNRLEIKKNTPPVVELPYHKNIYYYPKKEISTYLLGEGYPIVLKWFDWSGAKSYLYELSRDQSFEDIYMTETIVKTFKKTNLPPGIFYFRVRINEIRGVVSAWSMPITFTINDGSF